MMVRQGGAVDEEGVEDLEIIVNKKERSFT